MWLHFHPPTNDDQPCISMLQSIIAYRDRNLSMVSIMRKILLLKTTKTIGKLNIIQQDIAQHKHRTCKLFSHNFCRLESKHITNQPDVTTTKTCLCGCPIL